MNRVLGVWEGDVQAWAGGPDRFCQPGLLQGELASRIFLWEVVMEVMISLYFNQFSSMSLLHMRGFAAIESR
jgi:hypothetical protein